MPFYDRFLVSQHPFEEALALSNQRFEEYGSIEAASYHASILMLCGRFAEAETIFLEVVDVNDEDLIAQVGLLVIYVATLRFGKMQPHLAAIKNEIPDTYRYFCAYTGDRAPLADAYQKKRNALIEWKGGLEEWKRTPYDIAPYSFIDVALSAHALNLRDECLLWITAIVLVYEPSSLTLNVIPQFRHLHSDERFREIMKTHGLPLD
jgi:hypothetical protein